MCRALPIAQGGVRMTAGRRRFIPGPMDDRLSPAEHLLRERAAHAAPVLAEAQGAAEALARA
jgi:hypothetical protein